MRFKIDENLPVEIAELLRSAGYDASTVLEQKLGGEIDTAVATVCQREERALVTLDLDFSDIRMYPPEEYHGLIVLRPQRQEKPRLVWVFERTLPFLGHEPLLKHLWIADESGVRIRGANS